MNKKPKPDRHHGHDHPPQVVVLDDYGYPVPAGTTPERLAQINQYRKANAEFAAWMKAKGFPADEDGHLADFMRERPDLYPPAGTNGLLGK